MGTKKAYRLASFAYVALKYCMESTVYYVLDSKNFLVWSDLVIVDCCDVFRICCHCGVSKQLNVLKLFEKNFKLHGRLSLCGCSCGACSW